jgi:hypothetical protein
MECLTDFLDISLRVSGIPFKTIHNHAMMMLFNIHAKIGNPSK